MKNFNILIVAFSFLIASNSFAQQVVSMQNLTQKGIDLQALNQTYNQILVSETQGNKSNTELITAYQNYINGIAEYFKKNGLTWVQPLSGFSQVYFNAEGKADYFIYQPIESLSAEDKKSFDDLLLRYIHSFNLSVKSNQKVYLEGAFTLPPNK